jgi:hypothetical protein
MLWRFPYDSFMGITFLISSRKELSVSFVIGEYFG